MQGASGLDSATSTPWPLRCSLHRLFTRALELRGLRAYVCFFFAQLWCVFSVYVQPVIRHWGSGFAYMFEFIYLGWTVWCRHRHTPSLSRGLGLALQNKSHFTELHCHSSSPSSSSTLSCSYSSSAPSSYSSPSSV